MVDFLKRFSIVFVIAVMAAVALPEMAFAEPPATTPTPEPEAVSNDTVVAGGLGATIGEGLCQVVGAMKGTVGKGIATLAVLFLGIGAFFGKVNWGLAVMTGVGIAAIFGATAIVDAVGGGAAGCDRETRRVG